MVSGCVSVASAGALAADLLAQACRSGSEVDTRLETVRGLAEDLGRRLTSLSEAADDGTPESEVEAALACADLATLAVCNLVGLPENGKALGAAATHLAAGAAHALAALAEADIGAPEAAYTANSYAENAWRDLRSAAWKADLAVRQLGEGG